MDEKQLSVSARWDPDAGVYVAESEDVPGLITEAETPELLVEKLRAMIPELLQLNNANVANSYRVEISYTSVETVLVSA